MLIAALLKASASLNWAKLAHSSLPVCWPVSCCAKKAVLLARLGLLCDRNTNECCCSWRFILVKPQKGDGFIVVLDRWTLVAFASSRKPRSGVQALLGPVPDASKLLTANVSKSKLTICSGEANGCSRLPFACWWPVDHRFRKFWWECL